MTGGIIQLVAYGAQDIFLTKDPQITYFKMVYRRHTNFSTETIPQKFRTKPNFGEKVSSILPRAGDLIRNIYIVFDLPKISKFIENDIESKKLKIAWVKKLGFALIKSVEIEIGGQLMDKHYGEWLFIWNELTGPKNKGYDRLIGNIKSVTDFTNGKDGIRIYVPLQFWFCKSAGLALPIVSLQYNEVKINLEINSAKSCYINAPKNYIKVYSDIVNFEDFEYIEQNIDGTIATGQYIYYDRLTRILYYNRTGNTSFKSITSATTLTSAQAKVEIRKTTNEKYHIKGYTSKFKTMPIINTIERTNRFPKINNMNLKNCFLLVEYIFLDSDERLKFSQATHEYLIEQVQYSKNTLIDSKHIRAKIGFSHPCKELIWFGQLNYLNETRNNDHFNFTSDYKYKDGEFVGKNLIKNETIAFNGYERVSSRSSVYFDTIQPYKHHSYTPATGINLFSFCLFPEKYQPSGPANLSKIDNLDIEFTIIDDSTIIDNANLKIYGITYNILRITNGLSGLVFRA
jgi:hypothetical protein